MRAPLLAAFLLIAGIGTVMAEHPQQAGSRATAFDHRTGNEWWVEVIVAGAPARVDAREDDGAWTALSLRSWGAWATSFHIEPGHRVQFRAAWNDGATVESCWFTHPAGIEQCDGAAPPPPPPVGPFDFKHGGGNAWWVEAKITPMPDAVEAMDTNGPWVSLAFKSWGEWAASFRIEPGHEVRFRAKYAGGAWQESCAFAHPSGVARSCGVTPPPSGPTYTFQHGGGNEWWIEAKVAPKPVAVEAMDTGGAWVPLEFKSWGEWAASFRIEQNHLVRFRATHADGSKAMSCWFTHPGGLVYEDQATRSCTSNTSRESPGVVTWPREGSYVRYFHDAGDHWPTGSDWSELNVTLRYTNGSWQQEVEGWSYLDLYDREGIESKERVRYTAVSDGPAYRDAPAHAGSTNYTTKKQGATVDAPALRWHELADPDCPCGGTDHVVHDGTELVLSARFVGRMSHAFRDVRDTDAPIAPRDPAPTPAPPPSWPKDGSYVKYAVHNWARSEFGPYDLYYNATFLYTAGAWTVHCVGTKHNYAGRDQDASVEAYDRTAQFGPPLPPRAPTAISNGTLIRFEYHHDCYTSLGPTAVAKSWLTVYTNRTGAPFSAVAWYADENATQDAAGEDYDAWWDPNTRLVLRWEHLPASAYGHSMGNMTDTDAPLRRR